MAENEQIEEKKHVNPFLVKKLSQTEEAKALAEDLEALNWKIQLAEWHLEKATADFNYKKLIYLKKIGYDVTDEDIKKAEELVNNLAEELDNGCAVC